MRPRIILGRCAPDGTQLLRALLAAQPRDAVFCGLKDPQAVQIAQQAGVGRTIDLELGARTDRLHGEAIASLAYVKALTDGQADLEAPMGAGSTLQLGPTALLIVDGVEVIVISVGQQTVDRTPLILHGIDPLLRKLVAINPPNIFGSRFKALAARIITTDPPG
ncbi:MAG TPA: MlrC C-terminal domain-containing protein [Mycobacteriales bacterium]|nr:MlrC C-terminal domain-containing protein [Mycobacteriales bacterium]